MQLGLLEDNVQEYFATARLRYKMFLYKQGKVKTNPLARGCAPELRNTLRTWRFCNVFREDDRVTIWVDKNVRQPYGHSPDIVFFMAVCRFFNKIETLQALKDAGLFEEWDFKKAAEVLATCKPVVGAAYIIKTPDNFNKGDGVLEILKPLYEHRLSLYTQCIPGITTLQEMHYAITRFYYVGPFMGYEIVSDLRHTPMLNEAPDIFTWAFPGPGCSRGLSWILANNFKMLNSNKGPQTAKKVTWMRDLLTRGQTDTKLWPKKWPAWEMREVEHWLCEYAKIIKCVYLGERCKQRYRPYTGPEL